jgi:hypothetical protein
MQQIADWLEKLGMSEYAQRFADNGIDVSALPHLTDQDLKDVGVLLGHRRKMLAAIGSASPTLCSGSAASSRYMADGVRRYYAQRTRTAFTHSKYSRPTFLGDLRDPT